ncbi:hypothetical protein LOAG_07265 [Loa loa]|uniref:Uncharacterized protein n=1 Tax=Loa loa TaxID=7209 RepID=A0A1I7VAF7_LOALO|nr:hypothetical protein LOAG_07265 [Loa loa]EFO21223.1 hypothetical protein LOAG_07265 [Loa loa]
MDEQLGDENLSSTILKKQLERIKKKEETRVMLHESIETEFSMPCSLEAYNLESANMEFWRFVAGKFASELDKLRADNLNLKNLINSRKTRLDELKDLNTEMLEKAQCLDNGINETKSTSSSSP